VSETRKESNALGRTMDLQLIGHCEIGLYLAAVLYSLPTAFSAFSDSGRGFVIVLHIAAVGRSRETRKLVSIDERYPRFMR